MNRPRNYEEMKDFAHREIENLACEMEERARGLRELATMVDSITDWQSFEQAVRATHVHDYGDDKYLEWLSEIANNWPGVTMGKEGGYW